METHTVHSHKHIEGDVIDITPAENYDWHRAKLRASLAWILSKVYSCNVPKELQDPFYETSEGQLALRPVLVNLMSSSELYCQACVHMFPDTHTQWQGHWSILQVLSRKGIYVSDVQDSSVTETVLVQTAPFKLKAHLALIDALMKAYTWEVASVEKVVKAVRRLTTFQASSELPDSPEEALIFWINKVCTVLKTEGLSRGEEEEIIEGVAGQKVRVLSKSTSPREIVSVSLLTDVRKDIGSGCCIAAVIAFYRPYLLNIKDLCLTNCIGIADSLHNLRQIACFCINHLPWKSFHFSFEDLLYAHEIMTSNIMAFISDLFFCFEGSGSSQCVDGGQSAAKLYKEKSDVSVVPVTVKKSCSPQNVIPSVPISLVTKRSFQRQSFEDTASNLGMCRSTTSITNAHQPLLPRRGRRSIPQEEGVFSGSPPTTRRVGRRTLSLCSPQDRESVHKSVLAWQDDQRSGDRDGIRSGRSGLLDNVSIDSELDQNLNANNSISLDLSDLDTERSVIDPVHTDNMEITSVTSGHSHPRHASSSTQRYNDHMSSRASTTDHKVEPLMPATLRPTKEREANHSKAEERGDRIPRRRKVPSSLLQHPYESLDLDISLSLSSDETSVSSLVSALSTVSSFAAEDFSNTPLLTRSGEMSSMSNSGDFTSDVGPAESRTSDNNFVKSEEISDHESRKISQEYRAQESDSTIPLFTTDIVNSSKPTTFPTHHQEKTTCIAGEATVLSKSPASTTSFAELKRLKDKLLQCFDRSGSQGRTNDCITCVDLKPTFGIKQGQGLQQVQDNPGKTSLLTSSGGAAHDTNGIDMGMSDLQQLRLKLEQKRKEIERKKHRQELQQNKMRQRLGKAAFMRVVSKHLDGRDEDGEDELCELPENLPNSTQAQLQARLGYQPQKLIAGGVNRSQPFIQVSIGPGSQNSITDWRTQSHLTEIGGRGLTDLASGAQRPGNLDENRHQFGLPRPGSSGASIDSSSVLSQTAVDKPFSRTGIQQTIDNVRNKWFRSDNILLSDQARLGKVGGIDGDSSRLHDLVAGPSRTVQEQNLILSQYPGLATSEKIVLAHIPTPPIPVPTRGTTSSPCPASDSEQEDYDSSLDKLNTSLTELQGEIMRLSLQHEHLKGTQSPVNVQPFAVGTGDVAISASAPSFLMQGLSQHGRSETKTDKPPQQTKTTVSVPYQNAKPTTWSSDITANVNTLHSSFLDSSQHTPHFDSVSQPEQRIDESERSLSASTDGFFVSFGDNITTPKRSKPQLADHHRMESPPPVDTDKSSKPFCDDAANFSSITNIANDVAMILAGQTVLATLIPQKGDHPLDESVPKVGFMIKDEAAIVRENIIEDEMQKKRVKLLEMQRKRVEEQEKKRIEKEAETSRKQKEKQLKEEEVERKKAEEKARREVIFQQYLHKKQEEEESPPKSRPKKRDTSATKQRPKSMYVKSKAVTSEPGSSAPDSGSSSREDLTGRPHMAGRSTPDVMSTSSRSPFHSRLPLPSQIRKAASCNTLQGTVNGVQGPSTYRRPPSPDLYRLKQQHRGSSQDSGSETGSGSNPGSDYAGPKLFVKPSSRSNRHIIVNAISHCCLAGSVNTDLKNKVLEEMSKCDANHFLILFRDTGCQYRALFVLRPETEEAFKVHGVGPKYIVNDLCEKFYKYNSGGKSFSEITSTKHLSVSIDAVVIHNSVWKSVKAVVKR